MATIKAPTMHDRIYVGTHGNLSVAFGKVELNGPGPGTVVELLDVPVGVKVIGLRVHTNGMGMGVTADIKLGVIPLAIGADLSAYATTVVPVRPTYTDQKAVLSAVLAGGSAMGTLEVTLEYLSEGY